MHEGNAQPFEATKPRFPLPNNSNSVICQIIWTKFPNRRNMASRSDVCRGGIRYRNPKGPDGYAP
jgi:hypothetical protein